MNKRQAERYSNITRALEGHGFTRDEVDALLRAGKVLQTWAEHECNGEIQRDELNGHCYWYNANGDNCGRTADREAGALKRCEAIAKAHGLTFYHQSDPRGAQVYMVRPGDVPKGADVGAYYSRGICVSID
jgi:hypothetical protein